MWERESTLADEIKDAWGGHVVATYLAAINDKLQATMNCLKSWSKEKFGAVNKEIEKLRKELESLHADQASSNGSQIQRV